MKKLTKRNRKRNRKVVFGYHAECRPEQRSYHTTTTTGVWPFKNTTCTYVDSEASCCNP